LKERFTPLDPTPPEPETNRIAPETRPEEEHLTFKSECLSSERSDNPNNDYGNDKFITSSPSIQEQPHGNAAATQLDNNEIVEIVLCACEKARAKRIAAYDLLSDPPPHSDQQTSTAGVMIVACGQTTDHVGTIADAVLDALDEAHLTDVAVKGLQTCEWVVLDAGPVVVNILRYWPKAHDVELLWEAHHQDRAGLRRT
jgi:ribosome-associated protein